MKTVSISAKQYDNIIYIAENVQSDKARESAYEKVKKLLLNDAKNNSKESAKRLDISAVKSDTYTTLEDCRKGENK